MTLEDFAAWLRWNHFTDEGMIGSLEPVQCYRRGAVRVAVQPPTISVYVFDDRGGLVNESRFSNHTFAQVQRHVDLIMQEHIPAVTEAARGR